MRLHHTRTIEGKKRQLFLRFRAVKKCRRFYRFWPLFVRLLFPASNAHRTSSARVDRYQRASRLASIARRVVVITTHLALITARHPTRRSRPAYLAAAALNRRARDAVLFCTRFGSDNVVGGCRTIRSPVNRRRILATSDDGVKNGGDDVSTAACVRFGFDPRPLTAVFVGTPSDRPVRRPHPVGRFFSRPPACRERCWTRAPPPTRVARRPSASCRGRYFPPPRPVPRTLPSVTFSFRYRKPETARRRGPRFRRLRSRNDRFPSPSGGRTWARSRAAVRGFLRSPSRVGPPVVAPSPPTVWDDRAVKRSRVRRLSAPANDVRGIRLSDGQRRRQQARSGRAFRVHQKWVWPFVPTPSRVAFFFFYLTI